MTTLPETRAGGPADSEQLFGMLFLFAGPVIAFIAALIVGW